MSRVIGRIFIVALLSAAVAWGVWAFALKRPDMQMQLYARSAELRNLAAKPKAAAPGSFQAVACAAGPCVLVEVGGQSFLVGAGDDAAEGLEASGLMRADIRAILLTDLTARSVAGLPSLRDATWHVGRRTALTVYGPAGVERVITGANALLDGSGEAAPETALVVGQDGEGALFSQGGVSVSSVPVASGAARIYRFDFGGKTLLVAGCGVAASDLSGASRGGSSVFAVLPAASSKMVEIEKTAAKSAGRDAQLVGAAGQGCLSVEDASKAVTAAHLNGAMLAPLYPAPKDAAAVRAWGVAVAAPLGVPMSAGAPGTLLALDSKPRPAGVEMVSAPMPAPAAASPAPPATTEPKPVAVIPPAAPKAVPTLAPKPAAPSPVAAPSPKPAPTIAAPKPATIIPPKPSPAVTSVPKPKTTPKPVATPAPAAPAAEPSPTPTATETPEPPPSPIFPLRNGIPQTDSPLRVGPRLTPTPAPTPGQ